jgi:hypothetical protein
LIEKQGNLLFFFVTRNGGLFMAYAIIPQSQITLEATCDRQIGILKEKLHTLTHPFVGIWA